MNSVEKILEAVTPEIYARFKTAIELKKWPDGRQLTNEQLEICLQAIIAYEVRYLPENERTGYVPPKSSACEHDDPSAESPVKWQ